MINLFKITGWLDLFVTNAGDLSGVGNKNFLYLNQGNGTFTEIALEAAKYQCKNKVIYWSSRLP